MMPNPTDNAQARGRSAAAEVESLRPEVMADIARVAATIDLARGLSFRQYLDGGGRFTTGTIRLLGGWNALCQATGVPRGLTGQPSKHRKHRRTWQKTKPARTWPQLDALLDQMLRRTKKAKGVLCLYGFKRRGRTPKSVLRATRAPARDEIIADIRAVSRSVGLLSPQLLNWDTYRGCGGRYSYEQTAAMGGFQTLRRAAAARAA
jgi:hypothetical protein